MDWKAIFLGAKEEFEQLRAEREKLEKQLRILDRRMEAVSSTIHALRPIVEEEAVPATGEKSGREWETTKSIRAVLQTAQKALSAPEISSALAAQGWPIASYTNPLSTIHTVLKRLIGYGQVQEVAGGEGPRFESVENNQRGAGNGSRMKPSGLRELCWKIVSESERPLTADDILTGVTERGIDPTQYANIKAVIYTHLNRMPDRVRSFKKRAQHDGKWQTYRYYEVIR